MLATSKNLINEQVPMENIYHMCGELNETMEHACIFLNCSFFESYLVWILSFVNDC